MRIILVSDIHHCHVTWYGVSSEERMERLVTHLNDEYERNPYDVILFLGDYSLDFWEWDIKGCYINDGNLDDSATQVREKSNGTSFA